jgi:hypothetical protein|tara:strand:- start:642 stop:788 length:147 start_codon:yes stop_codon:yes gene_type:complete
MKADSKKGSLKNFKKSGKQAMKNTGNFKKTMSQMGKNATFGNKSKTHA